MHINFKGQELELSFGFKALDSIDRKLGVEVEQMKVGLGVQVSAPMLLQGNPFTIGEYILACTSHHKNAPKVDDIDEILDDIALNQGLEDFGEEIAKEMGKRPMLQKYVPEEYRTAKKDKKQA
ncbi:tail assembly chaperone [Staphylococcus epidermidis]|uniref:tail assembly chaperone n=1 Tax=Staphylococcus epidermidis TaxID=1282 RepID=UPI001931F15B|nr:tail assembly chaperone [Staphylococcus epidermidis]MBM0772705.1 phage tail protein [Staphylococcus epidermidis]MBX5334379.1 phage tail protein [Rhodococcus fascians]MCF7581275.1 tail assembly chaperone [Staphylococcus epidermidis]MCG1684574.1 tail assembly chaperone [Staphylococcus epidermidis]